MGRVVGLTLVGALVVGAGYAASNAVRYDIFQPFPLAWNHSAEELQLFELRHARAMAVAKLGSARRVIGMSGLAAHPGTTDDVQALEAEVAGLDARILALEARIPVPAQP